MNVHFYLNLHPISRIILSIDIYQLVSIFQKKNWLTANNRVKYFIVNTVLKYWNEVVPK